MPKSLIKKTLRPVKAIIYKAFYFIIDQYESAFNLREELTPPRSIIFVGDGDFKKTGAEFLKHFIELGKLKASERVLDVGCGIGRMAVPLTTYLSREGSYEGFDIVPAGIKWCQEKITPKYPNFRFQLADIRNDRYHPNGKSKASDYKFPFADQSFDFVFLTSVFTHLLSRDMENYLSEISRVLKKDGRCFVTYFLLNEDSLKLITQKQSRLSFSYHHNEYAVEDEGMPEAAVSYTENYVRSLFAKHGLRINVPIHYGSWCGRKEFVSFQDIIVLTKS